MKAQVLLRVCAAAAVLACRPVVAQDDVTSAEGRGTEVVRFENEHSRARIEPGRLDDRPGLAVVFEGTDDLHYYAKSETAPAPGFDLQVAVSAPGATFDEPVFPSWSRFYDPAQEKEIEVYVGDFTIFVPFERMPSEAVEAQVKLTGLACTSKLCLPPFEKTLTAAVDPGGASTWPQVSLETADVETHDDAETTPAESPTEKAERQAILPYGTGVYYLLAIVAGLSINIMPCVLPVIPLILMRLIEQSKQSSGKRIASGMAFCGGVILFFAAFAIVSAIISLSTGAVIDLNSLFRYPAALIVLFLAIVFFGLAMLDVVSLSLPAAIAGKQSAAAGVAGSAGMGFFAGILSTPCSGALLGFVLVWAQTQPLLVSSTAIVLMGVGMALPYAVIVLVPSLLERVPKPGTWMEIFKKSTGFLLFFVAAKLTLAALPKDRLLNVLTYGIIFSFCVWMWAKWVGFSTPAGKKWAVRLVALVIAVAAGYWLLPAPGLPAETRPDWHDYDGALVGQATAQARPVVIKFTADWCTNCKLVEKRVYHDPEVVDLIKGKNVLPIKADTTLHDYPATVALKEVYGEAGNVPVTVVIRPDGTREKLRGIFDKEQLIEILESLPEGQG
jgi:thiol:disulfide interchange protein DsbD